MQKSQQGCNGGKTCPGETHQVTVLVLQRLEEVAYLLFAHGFREAVPVLKPQLRRDIPIQVSPGRRRCMLSASPPHLPEYGENIGVDSCPYILFLAAQGIVSVRVQQRLQFGSV